MFIAMRVFLVLFLALVGMFASLAEVNAGRFCRRASACPCRHARPLCVAKRRFVVRGRLHPVQRRCGSARGHLASC